MTDPQQTISYLDELERLGFTDEAFRRLHHFRENEGDATIKKHRDYCTKIGKFQKMARMPVYKRDWRYY